MSKSDKIINSILTITFIVIMVVFTILFKNILEKEEICEQNKGIMVKTIQGYRCIEAKIIESPVK